MTFSLAAISWVDDDPIGVRLRWRFPAEVLGLPNVVVIERAPLRDHRPGNDRSVADVVPSSWWDFPGDVHLQGVPALEHVFTAPVDAVRYTQGGTARVIAYDEHGSRVDDRVVADGDHVEIAQPRIARLRFLTFDVRLEKLAVLDLARDRDLPWEPIARIRVASPLHGPYADVKPRLPASPIDDADWDEVVALVAAGEGDPALWVPGEPTPWQVFDTVLGIRWAHAVLAGAGFVDGPGVSQATVDDIERGQILGAPPALAHAYRVVELKARDRAPDRSTIAVVAPGIVPPLGSPSPPSYTGGVVRLRDGGGFEATIAASWSQSDPLAIGVVLEELTSASVVSGAPVTTEHVESRSRRPEDPPLGGSLVRVRDVPGYDVTVSARASAIDGWDRESAPSAFGPAAPLDLVHDPSPPLLVSGSWSSGTTRLRVAPPEPGEAAWAADALVAASGGEGVVCRRTRDPIRAGVTTGPGTPVGDELIDIPVSGVPAGVSFVGGRLLAGGRSVAVVAQGSGSLTVAAPSSAGGTALALPPGPAIVVEDALSLAAWTEVHAVPATAVPAEITFAEPHPLPAGGVDVCTYALRVRFLGRRGPLGNAVAVSRLITAPPPPPPFTVELLDVDRLRRTLVEVALTDPAAGEHVIAWARGALAGDAFARRATEGDLGPIEPYDGRLLHDVFSLPIPQSVDETVTIGVTKLGPAGTRSAYRTVLVTVPAPAAT